MASEILDEMTTQLRLRGYRCINTVTAKRDKGQPIDYFEIWTDVDHVVVLQVYKEGGFQLYRPVTDRNDLRETILAIP